MSEDTRTCEQCGRPILTPLPDGSAVVPHVETAMMIANHLLPDDSLYKITRADVDAVEEGVRGISAMCLESCVPSDNCRCAEFAKQLSRLAAKLAALLPPE